MDTHELLSQLILNARKNPDHHQTIREMLKQTPHWPVEDQLGTGFLSHIVSVSGTHSTEEVVEIFIEAGADVNHQSASGWTPLLHAARLGSVPMLTLLLESNRVNIDHQDITGATALILASEARSVECLELLLEHGANPNIITHRHRFVKNGISVFDYYYEQPKIIRLLLEHGADPNLETDAGSPLIGAATSGCRESVQILLEFGAKTNTTGFGNMTAIELAMLHRKYEVVNELIPVSDLNRKNDSDMTLMMSAVAKTQYEIVANLLRAGADPNLHDRYRCSALDYAWKDDQLDIAFLLLEKGAECCRPSLLHDPIRDLINRYPSWTQFKPLISDVVKRGVARDIIKIVRCYVLGFEFLRL